MRGGYRQAKGILRLINPVDFEIGDFEVEDKQKRFHYFIKQ